MSVKLLRAAGIAALVLLAVTPSSAQRRVPKDLSGVRGFNYMAAGGSGHEDHWRNYSPAETARDLDWAKKLQLNQMRVLIPYQAWAQNKEALKKNLQDLVRAAYARGIGVMPTLMYAQGQAADKSRWPETRAFAADLVAAVGKEPGLAFWDASNEPDCCALPPSAANRQRMEHALYMVKALQELDPVTPVTIGATFAANLPEYGDTEDVLSFHNYLQTRGAVDADIALAKAYAAKVNKPLINTEMGCIARANPYDMAIEEHMKAGVGWYIWELMITHSWGTVHGVFHPDGTIRDPTIVAALMGFFRDRDEGTMPAVPDREGYVTRAVNNNKKWLADPAATWERGLDLAEVSANLLEAGQLIAMYDPPTRTVALLRKGAPDMPALRSAIEKYTGILEPFEMPANDTTRGRPQPGTH